jgi:hypothetical protein
VETPALREILRECGWVKRRYGRRTLVEVEDLAVEIELELERRL